MPADHECDRPGVFKTGKLPASELARLLARRPVADDDVLVWPGIGRDAAVISLSDDRCLVAATDPITFATDRIGWYAVQVNANDIATTGARPRWFMATLLLPEGKATSGLVESLYDDLSGACRELGVALIGGHTEITVGLDRPILIGQMMGDVARKDLIQPENAQPGDALLLTKGIAIEGTALLGIEAGARLTDLGDDRVERCSGFLSSPGISVVRDALTACACGGVHAMHDPTEGGIAGGLWEMAQATGCDLAVSARGIPVYAETRQVCEAVGLDPLGLIASGALLIGAAAECADGIVAGLEGQGLSAVQIGEFVAASDEPKVTDTDTGAPFPQFERDEIARAFESA